jgi:hypothetical protein
MNEPKPFASLGPTLLARKGGARPAMRPQMGALAPAPAAPQPLAASEADLEDLGWNDMGEEDTLPARPSPVHMLTPLSSEEPEVSAEPEAPRPAPPEPEVRRQQRAVAEAVGSAAKPVRRPAANVSSSRRAAFTLRLDGQRHLQLRLASTVCNRSAQALVTEALDKFLADNPEIGALAAQLQRD